MTEQHLSLESQLYLTVLEHQISNLGVEDLRVLFIQQATQKAQQEHAYKGFLKEAFTSEKECHRQLNQVEKEYEAYRRSIAKQE